MTPDQIEQFRKMAKANPEDDLAHFALGQALLDAQRSSEAIPVLRHLTRINPEYTRAYLLLGRALDHDEDEEGAIEAWQLGYHYAMKRGELMISQEVRQHLEAKNAPLSSEIIELLGIDEPQEEIERETREPLEDEVICIRTQRIGKKMKFQPFENTVGTYILNHVSQESWEGWMEMSIKVINELRLDLGDQSGQEVYDQHMRDYLNLPSSLFETDASTSDQ